MRLVYQDLYLPCFEDLFGCTYIFRKLMMSSVLMMSKVQLNCDKNVLMFSGRPKKIRTPLKAAYHPELDTTEFCDDKEIKQYQTLIGQLKWLISLGRFGISVHCHGSGRNQEKGIYQGQEEFWVPGMEI